MTPGQRIGSIAVIVGIAGGLALVAGGAAIALRGGGEMGRQDIDELERQVQFGSRYRGPMMWKGSQYRVFGPARGVEGNIELSVGDMVNAWRTGGWRRDPQWRIVFLMLFGAAAMIAGGSGAIFAFGSPSTRLGFGVCLAYGIAQAWIGIRRARSRST